MELGEERSGVFGAVGDAIEMEFEAKSATAEGGEGKGNAGPLNQI